MKKQAQTSVAILSTTTASPRTIRSLEKALVNLCDMLPYVTNVIQKSKGKKGLYALNAMTGSIHDLSIEIKTLRDIIDNEAERQANAPAVHE